MKARRFRCFPREFPHPIPWSAALALAVALGAPAPRGKAQEQDLSVTPTSAARLADQSEASAVLSARDPFTAALSLFDRQSRLQTDGDAPLEKLLEFAAQQALPWQDTEKDKLRSALASIQQRLQPLQLPLPARILLIKTTGREEGGAAYCRGKAIVLPERVVQRPKEALERLLIHELFHILSRTNPDLRDMLYADIGFRPCRPIELPDVLRDRKITNPDGPVARHYIQLQHEGETVSAVPILYANAERYDPSKGGRFFDYLVFRLLVVTVEGDRASPVLKDGQPVLIDPRDNASFFRQIGRNTTYILHPDEILADNFVHLVLGTERLQSPEVVERMRKRLASGAD